MKCGCSGRVKAIKCDWRIVVAGFVAPGVANLGSVCSAGVGQCPGKQRNASIRWCGRTMRDCNGCLLHCNRCTKDGSRYGATMRDLRGRNSTEDCYMDWIGCAKDMFHLFHYGATRLLERLLWMWGQALRDSDHLWLNALYHCAGSVDSVDMLCWEKNWLTEELWEEGAEIRYLNNKKLTEERTQRWMLPRRRGGWEVMSCWRAEIYTSKKNFLRDSFFRVFVQSLSLTWLFSSYIFASTCTHIIHITTHHITSHHMCITLQNVSGTLCSLGDFLGFLLSLFSLLLATHWMFHLSFCEVFPCVSTVFDIGFLVLRGICGILEHGRWILHFGTSTCRLPRYLQHVTPNITQTIVVFLLFLHVLAILCGSGCGYRACVFLVVLVVLAALAVLVGLWLLLCLWLWFRLQLWLVNRKYKPNQTESLRCHTYMFVQTWKQGLPYSKLTLLWKMTRQLFYLKNAGFLRTCKKHIKIPCRRLPSDTCWQRHCTSGGTKLQPQGVSKAPRFVVKWMKQTNRGDMSTTWNKTSWLWWGDPFQQASLK